MNWKEEFELHGLELINVDKLEAFLRQIPEEQRNTPEYQYLLGLLDGLLYTDMALEEKLEDD